LQRYPLTLHPFTIPRRRPLSTAQSRVTRFAIRRAERHEVENALTLPQRFSTAVSNSPVAVASAVSLAQLPTTSVPPPCEDWHSHFPWLGLPVSNHAEMIWLASSHVVVSDASSSTSTS